LLNNADPQIISFDGNKDISLYVNDVIMIAFNIKENFKNISTTTKNENKTLL
jgi:hypothetical protein